MTDEFGVPDPLRNSGHHLLKVGIVFELTLILADFLLSFYFLAIQGDLGVERDDAVVLQKLDEMGHLL